MNRNSLPENGYQKINILDGPSISGNDRSYLDRVIFREDLTGKNILDIGSYYGYFCIEALKHGAKRAVGIEPRKANINVARSISSHLNVEPEYIETDFESWETDEKFDIILCLNVLHHMYDPIHALRKMVDMARDKIIIEFSAPRWRDVVKGRISIMSFLARRDSAIMMGRLKNLRETTKRAEYTFMFTPSALKTFFNTYYTCFGPVFFMRSPFKDRMIAIIEKRKVETITVVAGLTSAGKSTFIKNLMSSSDFRKRFNIPDHIDTVASGDLYQSPLSDPLKHVILHYDILRPFDRALRTHDRDPVLSFLSTAKNVNILTIKPSSERLIEQITSGEPKSSERHQKIKHLYLDPEFLSRWYGSWEDFIKKIPNARCLTIDNNGEEFQIKGDEGKI
jgi:2-polyprenyl-3-methyl-5-hydroxy-6-metoxy-1,4-benzoquinol methylase